MSVQPPQTPSPHLLRPAPGQTMRVQVRQRPGALAAAPVVAAGVAQAALTATSGMVYSLPPWQLTRPFYWPMVLAAVAMVVFVVYSADWSAPERLLPGLLVLLCASVPAWLWCTGRVGGLPFFPLYALMHIPWCASPLLTGGGHVSDYTFDEQLRAALTTFGYLAIATVIWLWICRIPSTLKPTMRCFPPLRVDDQMLTLLAVATTVQIGLSGNWFPFSLTVSIVLMASASVAITVLSYRIGTTQLRGWRIGLFLMLMVTLLSSMSMGLVLALPFMFCLMAMIAYTSGRGRVPLATAVAVLTVFSLLHVGKWTMRDMYWNQWGQPLQVWEYPGRLMQWFEHSLDALTETDDRFSGSLAQRASIIHMLMLVQRRSPDDVPMLDGASYAVIPVLLIPRWLYPEKPLGHEATHMLGRAYGLHGPETNVTIAFGLLAEAYANYGYAGTVGLAIIIGVLLGFVTRLTFHSDFTSFRTLLAMSIFNAILGDASAASQVSSAFQSLIVLSGISWLWMRPTPVVLLPPWRPI